MASMLAGMGGMAGLQQMMGGMGGAGGMPAFNPEGAADEPDDDDGEGCRSGCVRAAWAGLLCCWGCCRVNSGKAMGAIVLPSFQRNASGWLLTRAILASLAASNSNSNVLGDAGGILGFACFAAARGRLPYSSVVACFLLTACLPACPALQMCLSWLRASSRQQRSKQPLLLPPLLVDACSSWPAGGGAAALPFSLPQAYSVAPHRQQPVLGHSSSPFFRSSHAMLPAGCSRRFLPVIRSSAGCFVLTWQATPSHTHAS